MMPRDEPGREAPFTVRVLSALESSQLHSESKEDYTQSKLRYRLDAGAQLSLEVEFRRQIQVGVALRKPSALIYTC